MKLGLENGTTTVRGSVHVLCALSSGLGGLGGKLGTELGPSRLYSHPFSCSI